MTSATSYSVAGTASIARATLARHGKSFAFANRFLDSVTADRCARLYAFCRYVDDIADECSNSTTAARQRLREIVQMLLLHAPPNDAVGDFLELCLEVDMPVDPAIELVRGVASDLGDVRVETIGALHRYCYAVAGTVGILMCGVLGVRDPRALPFAIDLGIAMQLTNIARDVREDAAAGRRYIPESIIDDLSPDSIRRGHADVKPLIAWSVGWLLNEADRFYRSGEEGLAYLPPRARLAIRIAARIYRQIGVRIRRDGCAVWRGRTTVTRSEKLPAARSALLAHVGGPGADDGKPLHSAALHNGLGNLFGTHHALLTRG